MYVNRRGQEGYKNQFYGLFILTHNRNISIGLDNAIEIKLDKNKQSEIKDLELIHKEKYNFLDFLFERPLKKKSSNRKYLKPIKTI